MRAEDRVYRPDDLPAGSSKGAPRLAVLGFPIGHSRSPQMHRAGLDQLALKHPEYADWDYIRIEVRPEALGDFLAMAGKLGFRGINLTVPHKEVVLPYLTAWDATVERVGAANTLTLTGDGRVDGSNTDGYGLLAAMRESLFFEPSGKRILVVGAGGAGRSAVDALLGAGALEVTVVNRTLERAEALVADLGKWYQAGRMRVIPLMRAAEVASEVDAVVQATSGGLDLAAPPPIAVEAVSGRPVLYEMIYGSEPTRFLRDALAAGWRAADGRGMLVFQGKRSLEIWTGETVKAEVMRAAVC